MRVYPELKGEYLIVRYLPICLSVAHMLMEHYDNEEYADCVLIVNTEDTYEDAKILYPGKKLIYYQQEHFMVPNHFRTDCLKRITPFDEIWDIDWNNISYYKVEHRPKVKFMPMRYTTWYEDKKLGTNQEPRFDLLFNGVITQHRFEILNPLSYKFEFNKTIVLWGRTLDEIRDIVADTKFCLNIHQLGPQYNNQEQIRIYELLMMGKSVITENSKINYFGDLVTEVDPSDIFTKIQISDYSDKSKAYKDMTYDNVAYALYRESIKNQYRQVGSPLDY